MQPNWRKKIGEVLVLESKTRGEEIRKVNVSAPRVTRRKIFIVSRKRARGRVVFAERSKDRGRTFRKGAERRRGLVLGGPTSGGQGDRTGYAER